jgi:CPA1 family monovalent cation:H+ antiporter
MNGVELLLVVIAAIAVSGLSERKGLQAPLILVMIGLAVSFIPGLPRLEIGPELILGLVLPPLLYSTAVEFSFVNFLRNVWAIIGLGVILVIVTALAAGLVTSAIVPDITVAAGLVLGSVVAPSDAVTAEAIGRRLGLPKRVMTILTGESLINDAAALTMFTITTVAVTHNEDFFISSPVPYFLYGVVVGIVVGTALAWIVRQIQRRLHDPGLETVLGLVLPFACYMAAEELHASGVIAVVTAGFIVGHNAGEAGYAARIQERQVWHSLDVLLEAFVFAYMGLQMKFVLVEVTEAGYSLTKVLLAGVVVLLVVMLIRPAYVLTNHARLVGMRAFYRRQRERHPELREQREQHYRERLAKQQQRREELERRGRLPVGQNGPDPAAVRRQSPVLPLKHDLVISWTGMRGVVTLAAAAGIPLLGASGPFPGRAVIQAIAFIVAVGTLLVQGFTLPLVIRKLKISSDTDTEYEAEQRQHATEVTQKAAAQVIKKAMDDAGDEADPRALEVLTEQLQRFQQNRQALQQQAEDAEKADADQRRARLGAVFGSIRMEMLDAQRQALTAERDAWRLDDDIYRETLEQLDYDAAATSARMSSRL